MWIFKDQVANNLRGYNIEMEFTSRFIMCTKNIALSANHVLPIVSRVPKPLKI
jgi:hypothetical protein